MAERFSNARTPAPRRPPLNTEERGFIERVLRHQGRKPLDADHKSPVRQDIFNQEEKY